MSVGATALPGPRHRGIALVTIRRWAAMLVLPASILPVVFLGPTLLRAPHKLWRQAGAELQRLEEPRRERGGLSTQAPTPTPSGSRRLDHASSSRNAARTAVFDLRPHGGLARLASAPRRARPSSERRNSR